MAVEHLAGDFDVNGVDVVEQAGSEEAADVEDEPGEDDEGDGAGVPAGGCGLGLGMVQRVGWPIRKDILVSHGGKSVLPDGRPNAGRAALRAVNASLGAPDGRDQRSWSLMRDL